MSDKQTTQDDRDLAQFGYQAQLNRTLSKLGSFCLAFSMMAAAGTLVGLMPAAVNGVGAVSAWFWLLAGAGVIWVVLVFMHMAARIPVAGYAYQWSARINGPYMGWLVALMGIITFTTGPTSVAVLIGSVYAPVIGLEPTTVNATYIAAFLLSFAFILNIIGIRIAANVNNTIAIQEMIAVFIFGGLLLIGALFLFNNASGFDVIVSNIGVGGDITNYPSLVGFLAAAVGPIFILLGWAGSADLAEETKNPRKVAPWAILGSVVATVVIGFFVMTVWLAAVPEGKMQYAAAQHNVMFWIVGYRFGPVMEGIFMLVAFLSMMGTIIANVAVGARLVFSVSRDGILPFSKQLSSVHPRWKSPAVTLVVLWVVCLLIDLFSGGHIFRVVSMAAVSYYLLYLFTVISVLRGAKRGTIPDAPQGCFGLGKALVPVCWIAIVWCIAVLAAYLAPKDNWYVLIYFFIALIGVGGALTIYAWKRLKSNTLWAHESEDTGVDTAES